jgi:hypothetical protein
MTRLNGLEIRSQVWNFWPRNDLLSTKNKMKRGKCATHLSLLHKRPCFFCGSQKGHKKKPRHLFKRLGKISSGSAIVSQIPNEYPDQPQTSGATSKYHIEDQSASAALSATFTFAHVVRPFS